MKMTKHFFQLLKTTFSTETRYISNASNSISQYVRVFWALNHSVLIYKMQLIKNNFHHHLTSKGAQNKHQNILGNVGLSLPFKVKKRWRLCPSKLKEIQKKK